MPEREAAAHAALHATTTAAAQLGPGELPAKPGRWAFAVACSVLLETARAADPDCRSSPERGPQCDLVRDIFGNPFRPVVLQPGWLTPAVTALAHGAYEEEAFDRLPALADALEEAGCTDAELLAHCRSAGPHVRGCWAIDLVLGKGPPGA